MTTTADGGNGAVLRSERIAGGILPKVLNSFDMVAIFVAIVLFSNYSGPHFVILELPVTTSSSDKLNIDSQKVQKLPLNDYYLINSKNF